MKKRLSPICHHGRHGHGYRRSANRKDQAYIDSGQNLDGAWLFRDSATGKNVVVQPRGGIGDAEHTVWFGSDQGGFLASPPAMASRRNIPRNDAWRRTA